MQKRRTSRARRADNLAVERALLRHHQYALHSRSKVAGERAQEGVLARLEARVTEIANVLLEKNPVILKAAKDAVRRVKDMTYDNAEDYLVRAQEAANFHDTTEGRKEGIRQFIDEKSFRPGLASYDLTKKAG